MFSLRNTWMINCAIISSDFYICIECNMCYFLEYEQSSPMKKTWHEVGQLFMFYISMVHLTSLQTFIHFILFLSNKTYFLHFSFLDYSSMLVTKQVLDDHQALFTIDFIAPHTSLMWLMCSCNVSDGTLVVGPLRKAYIGCK